MSHRPANLGSSKTHHVMTTYIATVAVCLLFSLSLQVTGASPVRSANDGEQELSKRGMNSERSFNKRQGPTHNDLHALGDLYQREQYRRKHQEVKEILERMGK